VTFESHVTLETFAILRRKRHHILNMASALGTDACISLADASPPQVMMHHNYGVYHL